MKYFQGVILLVSALGVIQVSDGDCTDGGYLGSRTSGTAPFCEGSPINYYDTNPRDGSWDKYYYAYGVKGKVPYYTKDGKSPYGNTCWSGKKYMSCWASHYKISSNCANLCTSRASTWWDKPNNPSKPLHTGDLLGYTPPGLFPIRTNQSRVYNNVPENFDYPYIVGAEIEHGDYITRDHQAKNGDYVNYCWCNWPSLMYDEPVNNKTISGADADGFSRDNPPYNINSLKGAMDWCSSQRPWQCTGVVATRVFPYPLEFIPKKGHTLVPSSLSFNLTFNADYSLNETFENAYLRKDAPNPNATGTTNRMKYL